MSGEQINNLSAEHDAVTRRMQQSRREIEILKAEYERLLEQGIQGRNTSNITDTDKQKEILSKKEDKDTTNNTVRVGSSIASSSNSRIHAPNRVVRKKPYEIKSVASSRQESSQLSPTKVRHYNVEDARDYIKKQKEKRLLQQRQLKETDNAIALKKQKLKELHQKSLQIVARNRERSKSREKQKLVDAEVPVPVSSNLNKNIASSKSSVASLKTHVCPAKVKDSNTYRVEKENQENKLYVKSSAKSDDAKIKAATLIQAYYRGHIQRKIYKKRLEKHCVTYKLTTEAIRVQKEAALAKKLREEEQLRRENKEKLFRVKEEAELQEKQRQDEEKRKKLPEWLQPVDESNPYNFITSVKKKMNVALNTPVKTIDVAVQSSFDIQTPPPESLKEVRDKIEQSLSSKKPNKRIDLQIQTTLKAIRDIQTKQLFNGHKNLELDMKRLNKMKLAGDISDSDTSKNIPDLSFESHSHKTSSSKIDSENKSLSIPSEPIVFFKHPKEPPPKPKRLSRIDTLLRPTSDHSTNKSQSIICSNLNIPSDSESATLASFPGDGEVDLQLRVDRLKDIKLQRRKEFFPDNTMMDVQSLVKGSNNSRNKTQDKKSHKVCSEDANNSSSSINTISNKSKLNSKSEEDAKSKNVMKSTSLQSENRISEGTMPKSSDYYNKPSDSKHSNRNSISVRTEINNSQSNNSKGSNDKKIPLQYSNGSGDSRRDSTISGQISQYTRSFESYKDTRRSTINENIDATADLQSFRQYMKDMDESKITHTPFQPKRIIRTQDFNPEQRLKEVTNKVNDLDEELSRSLGQRNSKLENSDGKLQGNKATLETEVDNPVLNLATIGEIVETTDFKEKTIESAQEDINNSKDKLIPPNVNLIDKPKENKLTATTSTETVTNGPSNQIHVKFEAELHLLNDFNDSLRQIMNIEKSMLDLQTKYNLNASRETRDTQTSIMTPRSSNNSSSIIEKSINFSRGSEAVEKEKPSIVHNSSDKEKSQLSSGSINISEISIPSLNNTTQQSTQNALTLNTFNVSGDMETTDKLNNTAGISLEMFNQLIKDEDARIENLKAVLKIREKALLDRTKSELTWLEIQKKRLLETGKLHEASLLKKKQRGIILKLQEETNEMQRLREAQKAASKERKTKLKEQRALIKAQLSGPHVITRIKRSSERRTSGPVKVYQSEYYQSETSISRKSSISENILYTSRSASILSKRSNSDHEDDAPRLEPTATVSRTEMAKRSLQMREAALQKRRKEAEDLLKWHQKLLKEERKIAELEMAASNVINQVPGADGDKYVYKSSSPAIWVGMSTPNKQKSELHTENGNSQSINESEATNLKGYSLEFDTEKEDCNLEKGIKKSESTLQEIMFNINNITDEISELYKISSVKKSETSQSNNVVDAIQISSDSSVSDASDSRTSKASIVLTNRKSVPEVSPISERISPENLSVSEDSNVKNNKIVSEQPELIIQEILDEKSHHKEETEEDVSSIQSELLIPTLKDELDTQNYEKSSSSSEESLIESLQINEISKRTSNFEEAGNSEIVSDIIDVTDKLLSEPAYDDFDEPQTDLSVVKTNLENNEQPISSILETNIISKLGSKTSSNSHKESQIQESINVNISSEVLNKSDSEVNKSDIFNSGLKSELIEDIPSLKENEIESVDSTSTIKEFEINKDDIDGNQEVSQEEISIISDNVVDVQINEEYLNEISQELKSDSVSDKHESEDNNYSEISEHNLSEEINSQVILEDNNSSEILENVISAKEEEEESYTLKEEESYTSKEEIISRIESPNKLILKIVELTQEETPENLSIKETIESFEDKEDTEIISIKESENLSIKEDTENQSIKETSKQSTNEDIENIFSQSSQKQLTSIDSEQQEIITSKLDASNELNTSLDSDTITASREASLQNSEVYLDEKDAFDKTLVAEDIEPDESPSETSTLKSHSLEEIEDSIPIIGVKIEEKRPTVITPIEDLNEIGKDSESLQESIHETSIIEEEEVSKKSIDVKTRVSKILADANLNTSIEEKSPRLPDIYVTTYDVITPDNSPELGSPVDNSKVLAKPKDIYGIGNEAQELLKKQLAIEQEIKQIERQQKQLPYLYVREIPNKPPPPYTPPVQQHTSIVPSSAAQIEEIVPHLAEIFYNGYVDKTLEYVTFPDLKVKKLDNFDKLCAEFLFDIAKELAVKHYKQFIRIEEETVPWMRLKKRHNFKRPCNQSNLESMLKTKLNQLFGFEKVEVKESMIIKWSRKRRDNVDELLVAESQAEEAEWTNYDQDELIVKDEVTNGLLDILIGETVTSLQDIFKKRRASHC